MRHSYGCMMLPHNKYLAPGYYHEGGRLEIFSPPKLDVVGGRPSTTTGPNLQGRS